MELDAEDLNVTLTLTPVCEAGRESLRAFCSQAPTKAHSLCEGDGKG